MATMVSRQQIMDKLGQVIDPELGVSIVDLGLIYGVEIEGGKPLRKGKGRKERAAALEKGPEARNRKPETLEREAPSGRKGRGGGEQQKIRIRMTFTTPACPMMNELLDDMKGRLEELGDLDIEISIVFEPLWTPDRMSDKAKIKLGML